MKVDGVSKRVRDSAGELTILHEISFQLGQRESVAIVGASGSGKSTLLSILAGLDTPSSSMAATCSRWTRMPGPRCVASGSVSSSRAFSSWAT